MFNLKKILIVCLLIVIAFTTISYAESVKVTDENLKSTFEKHKDSFVSLGISSVSISNNIINVINKDFNYVMQYDLTNKPIFTYEAVINKGMTYGEFEKQTDCGTLHMIAFIAVADIQGIEASEAMSYYMSSVMNGSFSLTDSKYIIVDPAPGVTITPSEGKEVILVSEFGDKVMEYVNEVYKDKYTKTDSTYTQTIERKDVTDSSCKIAYTLEINTDTLYSELYKDGNENDNTDENENNENENQNQNSNENNNIDENVNNNIDNNIKEQNQINNDNSLNGNNDENINEESKNDKDTNENKNTISKLPQTGSNKFVLLVGILVLIIIMSVFKKKIDKYNK